MGQEEILRFLEEMPEPLTRLEIADELKENPIKISKILSRLVNGGDVDYIELDRLEAIEMTKQKNGTWDNFVKRKIRLFYAVKKTPKQNDNFILKFRMKFKNLYPVK